MKRMMLAGCLAAGSVGGSVAAGAVMAAPAGAVAVPSDCFAPDGGSSVFPVEVSWPYLSPSGDGNNALDAAAPPNGADGVVLQACAWKTNDPSAPLGSVTVGSTGGGYVLVQTSAGYIGYDGGLVHGSSCTENLTDTVLTCS